MSKQAKAATGGDHFTRWLVIGMVSLVVVTGVVFSIMSSSSKATESFTALEGFTMAEAVTATINPAAGSGLTLNPGAPVTIDLWEDPQCPVCRIFETSIGAYIDTQVRTKKATVVYHVLSFLGPESVRAANAMMCAADEGHYLDFHQAIYTVQPELENSGFFSNVNLIKIGDYIGLTSKTFTDCVTQGSKLEIVKAHEDSMPTYKVNGTPTVFINGKLWERKASGFDLNEFRLAVEAG
jgi:protein-disulfide isomerase